MLLWARVSLGVCVARAPLVPLMRSCSWERPRKGARFWSTRVETSRGVPPSYRASGCSPLSPLSWPRRRSQGENLVVLSFDLGHHLPAGSCVSLGRALPFAQCPSPHTSPSWGAKCASPQPCFACSLPDLGVEAASMKFRLSIGI